MEIEQSLDENVIQSFGSDYFEINEKSHSQENSHTCTSSPMDIIPISFDHFLPPTTSSAPFTPSNISIAITENNPIQNSNYYDGENKNSNKNITIFNSSSINSNITQNYQDVQATYPIQLNQWKKGATVMKSQKLVLSTMNTNSRKKGYNQFKQKKLSTQPTMAVQFCREIESIPVFYLSGNIIFDFRTLNWQHSTIPTEQSASSSSRFSLGLPHSEISCASCTIFKDITHIHNMKDRCEVSVHHALHVEPVEDFSFLFEILNRFSHSQLIHELLPLLRLFEQNVVQFTKLRIRKTICLFEEKRISIVDVLAQRKAVFEKHQRELIEKYSAKDSCYLMQFYTSDYDSLEQNQQNHTLSYNFLALVGLSPNDFSLASQKCYTSSWIQPHTRSLLMLAMLRDLTQAADDRNSYAQDTYSEIDPFSISTIDELVVSCTAKRYMRRVRQSEYLPQIEDVGLVDYVSLIVLDFEALTIQRILNHRSKLDMQAQALQYVYSIEYSVKSQLFLEKHYPKEVEQIISEEKSIQEQEQRRVSDSNKTCNYRIINNSKTTLQNK